MRSAAEVRRNAVQEARCRPPYGVRPPSVGIGARIPRARRSPTAWRRRSARPGRHGQPATQPEQRVPGSVCASPGKIDERAVTGGVGAGDATVPKTMNRRRCHHRHLPRRGDTLRRSREKARFGTRPGMIGAGAADLLSAVLPLSEAVHLASRASAASPVVEAGVAKPPPCKSTQAVGVARRRRTFGSDWPAVHPRQGPAGAAGSKPAPQTDLGPVSMVSLSLDSVEVARPGADASWAWACTVFSSAWHLG